MVGRPQWFHGSHFGTVRIFNSIEFSPESPSSGAHKVEFALSTGSSRQTGFWICKAKVYVNRAGATETLNSKRESSKLKTLKPVDYRS